MTDPEPRTDWTSPAGRTVTPPVTADFQSQPQQVYASAQPDANWGVAAPGAKDEVLVRRPPRPRALRVALLLVYVGTALSLVELVAEAVWQGGRHDGANADIPREDAIGEAIVSGVIALIYLVIVACVMVTAVLTHRKQDPARITLAVFMGVIALNQLCSAGGALLVLASADRLEGFGPTSVPVGRVLADTADQLSWWSLSLGGLLGVISAITFVLLLLPSTNRYFNAGAGRRFTADPERVRFGHDRP